jgi:hypothetical protein
MFCSFCFLYLKKIGWACRAAKSPLDEPIRKNTREPTTVKQQKEQEKRKPIENPMKSKDDTQKQKLISLIDLNFYSVTES